MSTSMRSVAAIIAVAGSLFAGAVGADIKLAYIDPLSGGAASAGILGQKHAQFFVDKINAAGGINGEEITLLPYDNKISPQETLIVLRKAIDEGARYVMQGNGSSVAHAMTGAVRKHNRRNPGREVLYFNYAAVDPALTNEKCNFWHFRFDADVDMKMAALTDDIAARKDVKRVYLINQDYSFGQAVAAAARRMLAEKRPDIEIVGNELHPLLKIQDFSPYVAKIEAAGAQVVITGNWSNDMLLLIKAGRDAGLDVLWYTYYAGSLGAPTAIGEGGVGIVKQVGEWHKNVLPELDPDAAAYEQRYTGKQDDFSYWRMRTMFEMFKAAAEKAGSNDPIKVATALEGMKMDTALGAVEMRADNHQLLQPLYVSTLADDVKYEVEGTGLGFETDARIDTQDTSLPTTCEMKRPD